MKKHRSNLDSFGLPLGVLSDAQMQELHKKRKEIIANARRTVDPDQTGFDAVMMSDDSNFFDSTDDPAFRDWLDWAERMISMVSIVSQRVSLAIASAGFAMAGATLAGSERTAGLGQVSMTVAGIFAIWFTVANIRGSRSGR
jgi:hypothetical protein